MISRELYKILPTGISSVLEKRVDGSKLYELRLRSNRPVIVNFNGGYYYLGDSGIKESEAGALIIRENVVNEIVVKATEYSLYAVNNQICNGYLTIKGGIRLGIAGEIVWENDKIKTIKNFSSLNIRIPHEILGAAEKVFDFTCKREVKNTLIISPPGAGKTTVLRDLSRILGSYLPVANVLLVDERNELAACNSGVAQLNVGKHTDIISGASKEYAFAQGIRALRPDVIITDELFSGKDCQAVEYAASSGVKVIASVHATDHIELSFKDEFKGLIKNRVFKRFVVLSSRHGPGTIDGIYDENFNLLYYS